MVTLDSEQVITSINVALAKMGEELSKAKSSMGVKPDTKAAREHVLNAQDAIDGALYLMVKLEELNGVAQSQDVIDRINTTQKELLDLSKEIVMNDYLVETFESRRRLDCASGKRAMN